MPACFFVRCGPSKRGPSPSPALAPARKLGRGHPNSTGPMCGGLDWVSGHLSELDSERAEVGDDGLGVWCGELDWVLWWTGLNES